MKGFTNWVRFFVEAGLPLDEVLTETVLGGPLVEVLLTAVRLEELFCTEGLRSVSR